MNDIVTPDKINKTLTIRYALALGLIALTIIAFYIHIHQRIQENENNAYIINISGMQRMLSQRIALMASDMMLETNTDVRKDLTGKMRKAMETMRANHLQLTSGKLDNGTTYELSKSIKNIYYGHENLDHRINQYLEYTDNFLDEYNNNFLHDIENINTLRKITFIAREGILDSLDATVSQYQKEAEWQIKKFQITETIFFIFAMALLVFEALFIFRPMTKNIIDTTEKLKNSNDELLEFSYRISHDLRAPIVSSLGLVKITNQAHKKGDIEKAATAVGHIQNSLLKLEILIKDIINLTKMKLSEIKPEQVNLTNMVVETLEKMNGMEEYKNIRIDKDIQIKEEFQIKKMFLQQILENLISNAIKYHDPEKEKPFIKIKAEQKEKNIVLTIIDNGIGIPEAQREKMFTMFERFHPKVSFGSGLGLYLVKQNAKALNGDVKYKARDDGSEFQLTFPIDETQ